MKHSFKEYSFRRSIGFTLIELLVVVSVLGVLAGIVVAVLKPQFFFAKGRDAQRKSDIQSVRAALEIYAVSQVDRKYPVADRTTNPITCHTSYSALGTPLADYLDGSLPTDPKSGWTAYFYSTNASEATSAARCTCFLLRATLEGGGTYDVKGGKGTGCP